MSGHTCVVDLAGVCSGPGPCDTTPFGAGDNWVNKVGGLPLYIRAIAKALRRSGHSESSAVATAVATVKRWAAGGGGVTPETRARAAAALAEWERKKAQSHALTASPSQCTVDLGRHLASALAGLGPADGARLLDLAADPVFSTNDGPNLTIPAGSHQYRHGWVRIDAAAPTAVERATRAAITDGHAMLHGTGMVPAAQKVIERMKAGGHTPTVKRVDVAGTPHLHIAKRATSDYTAAPASTVDLAFTEQLHPRAPKGAAGGGRFAAKNNASAPPADMAANVRDFQRRMKLPVTGVVDSATAAKIRAELAAKGGGRGKGKGRGGGKAKARKAAAAARRQAKASTRAQKQQLATHVATVNAMTPAQRAAARNQMPVPPTGYVWTPTNTLRRFHA